MEVVLDEAGGMAVSSDRRWLYTAIAWPTTSESWTYSSLEVIDHIPAG